MEAEIKKAVIAAAGAGTRFLPLTKVCAKELLPLLDKPLIDYSVSECKDAGINRVIFVLSPEKRAIFSYFKKNSKILNALKRDSQKEKYLKEFLKKEEEFKKIFFSCSFQTIPRGDGDAVLKARNCIKKEPFAVFFPDDVFVAKKPPISQLGKIFQTSGKIVVGLKKISAERASSYGIAAVEKIANRLYKIKNIKEKPVSNNLPSNLAVVGRYILIPEIFAYLKKTLPNERKEILLVEAINLMLRDGKVVYGYEIDGEWLECGDKAKWIESNFCFALKHPEYGPKLKEMAVKGR